jgi:hypothetical protein
MDHVEALHLIGDLEVAKTWIIKSATLMLLTFLLLHLAVGGTELGILLLEQLPPSCERDLILITHKRVINQVFLLMKLVVNLPPKCGTLLLGTTNWNLSNFYPHIANARALELFGPYGPSCGLGSEQWLVLEQWLSLDVDRGCCQLGWHIGSPCPFIDLGLHGLVPTEEGLVHMPSG